MTGPHYTPDEYEQVFVFVLHVDAERGVITLETRRRELGARWPKRWKRKQRNARKRRRGWV